MAFTPEQKAAYLKDSTKCPKCGSWHIEGNEINIEVGSLSQEIDCKNCGASWYDVYKLVDIEER